MADNEDFFDFDEPDNKNDDDDGFFDFEEKQADADDADGIFDFDEKEDDDQPDTMRPEKNTKDDFVFCIVLCKLCGETMSEPVSLPCGHNFCRLCLHAQMANVSDDQNCSCRICRASFVEYTKKNGVKNFRENYLLSGLIGLIDQFVDNNDALFDLIAGSRVDLDEKKNAIEIKQYMNKLASHALVDDDFVILENQIKKLEHARRIGMLRSKAFKSRLAKTIIRDVKEENLPKYIRASLINDDLVDQAKHRFQLPKEVYNLIVIQTDPEDFRNGDRFFNNIMSLPIRGIAAERSIVIVQCISQHLDIIINEVFDVFQLTYEGIVSTWVEDDEAERRVAEMEGKAAPKRRSKPQGSMYIRQVNANKTHLFVAGTIGQVRAMREKNMGNTILEIKASPLPSTVIPYKMFEALTKLLSVYQNRCLILTSADKEASVPNGWDVAKVQIN